MRISVDEHGEDAVARHKVSVEGVEIPIHTVIEANEEAFYVLVHKLDSHGCKLYRYVDGAFPGQTIQKPQTQIIYGDVSITRR